MLNVNFDVTFNVKEKGKNSPQYSLESDKSGAVTLEELINYARSTLVKVAYNALLEEQAKGFTKTPVITVDSVRNKRVDEVKPFGRIFFTAPVQGNTFLLEVYESILSRQPHGARGIYAQYNWVLFNGKVVATNPGEFKEFVEHITILPKDVIRFVNVVPYASRLERLGVSQGRQKARAIKSKDKKQRSGFILPGKSFKSISGANGTYYLATRALRKKYKQNAKINFAFIPGDFLGLPNIQKISGKGAMRRTYKETGDRYLYPCVVVRVGTGEGFK